MAGGRQVVGQQIKLIRQELLVAAGRGMLQRFQQIATRGEKAAGAAMQFGSARIGPFLQPPDRHRPEQRMEGVNAAFLVDRVDEQARAIGIVEHRPRVVITGDRRARWPGQLVKDAGVDQEGAHLGGLQPEHLFREIAGEFAPQVI